MEESRGAELVELDRYHLGIITGGVLAPTRDTSFWYDVAYCAGYAAGVVCDTFRLISYTANTGSYSYAKTGMP